MRHLQTKPMTPLLKRHRSLIKLQSRRTRLPRPSRSVAGRESPQLKRPRRSRQISLQRNRLRHRRQLRSPDPKDQGPKSRRLKSPRLKKVRNPSQPSPAAMVQRAQRSPDCSHGSHSLCPLLSSRLKSPPQRQNPSLSRNQRLQSRSQKRSLRLHQLHRNRFPKPRNPSPNRSPSRSPSRSRSQRRPTRVRNRIYLWESVSSKPRDAASTRSSTRSNPAAPP